MTTGLTEHTTPEIIPGIKLCQECRFFLSEDEKCGHASALVIDYVHGNHTRHRAAVQRMCSGRKDCGEGAQFFEPRHTDNVVVAAFARVAEVEAAQ